MKKMLWLVVWAVATVSVQAQSTEKLRHIKPDTVCVMPSDAVMAEFDRLQAKEEQAGETEDSPLTEKELQWMTETMEDNVVLCDLYAGYCSWYCGGEVLRVTASSHLKSQGRFNYLPRNAHDFNHRSVWAEGVPGQGIGQWLDYEFAGGCPRITHVVVVSGHVKTQAAWEANSRPKQLKVYYMGKPYAILDLEDVRGGQVFDLTTPRKPANEDDYDFNPLGYHDCNKPNWHLRFEILDVYPGTKYEDCVISELYFDGIDVH